MNRFRRIFLMLMVLVILAAAVWKLTRPRITIATSGKLSLADVEEISAAVRKDQRKGILPDFSWASFKRLPANMKFYLQYEIASIQEDLSSNAMVEIKNSHKSAQPDLVCAVIKGTNGWQLDSNAFIRGSGGYIEIYHGLLPATSPGETNSKAGK